MNVPEPPTEHSSRANPTTALLLAGISLILIAVVVIVTASWQQFSPIGRILATFLPLCALYAMGLQGYRSTNRFAPYLLVAASTIVPFVTGVLLQQSGFGTVNDPAFWLIIGLVTLSVSLYFEFGLQQTFHTPLTILSLLLVPQFAANLIWTDQSFGFSLAGIASGVALLVVATKVPNEQRAHTYTVLGILAGWLGVAFLPALLFINEPLGVASLLLYLGFGLLLIVLAIYSSGIYIATKDKNVLLVRQTAEQTAPLLLILPAVLACMGDPGNPTKSLLLLIIGVLVTLFSSFILVRSFRILGYGGMIGGLLFLLFLAFSALQASWPLVLLAVGFVLIAAAYGLQHRANRDSTFPTSLLKWKEAITALGSQTLIVPQPTPFTVAQPVVRSNDSLILIVVLLVIACMYAILSQFNQNSASKITPYPMATPRPQRVLPTPVMQMQHTMPGTYENN